MTNLNRTLERRLLRGFSLRAYLYSEDEGRLEKFRPNGLPSTEWSAGIKKGGVMMQSTQ